MASVKQFDGCSTYTACYKVFAGFGDNGRPRFEREQHATGLTDRRTAEQVAAAFERASEAAAARAWNLSEGKRLIQTIEALLGCTVTRLVSVQAFADQWLEEIQRDPRKREKTRRNYRCILNNFLAFLGQRALRPIHETSTADILDFRKSEMENGKSANTWNKAAGVLGQLFTAAVKYGAATENPLIANGTLLFPGSKKNSQKRKALSLEQFRALLQVLQSQQTALAREWFTFILLLGYTGGRQQEPAKLRWEDIDLGRGLIVLHRSKTRDDHVMPLHPALRAHLGEVKPAGATGYVMPHIAAQKVQQLSKTFREEILPRIGLLQPYHTRADNPEKGAGRCIAEYSLHSLRHSLSTWLDAAGVSDATRMTLVGHEDECVSLGYTHPEFQVARAALERIPSVLELSARRKPAEYTDDGGPERAEHPVGVTRK